MTAKPDRHALEALAEERTLEEHYAHGDLWECPYPCCNPVAKADMLAEPYEDRPDMDPNPTVDDRLRRYDLRCSYCPPNRCENVKTPPPRHGTTKKPFKKARKK